MNKHWVLQCNNIDQNQVERVRAAAIACGDTVGSVRCESFTGKLEFIDPVPDDRHVIPYGSHLFIKGAHDMGWPGVFISDDFNVASWVANRDDMLNQHVVIMTAAEAARHDWHDSPRGWFVRPNEDFKLFAGCVEPTADALRIHMARIAKHYAPDHLVCVSPVVEILAEWRWFVVGGRVVSGAQYMQFGDRISEPELDPWFIRQAQALADRWLPHPTCVMDTAVKELGKTKVLEFNNLNNTGFYGHDIPAIVRAISEL